MKHLAVMATDPIITFTSDFGNREYYVGAVKGTILNICPSARIVDISHEVGSHDLLEGAFTLLCTYAHYPVNTIHLVVIDPGVGSKRQGIIISTDHYYFVGPDNGVLSLLDRREKINHVISIEAEHYFRRPISPTFHARDIFGPVAGWIAQGTDITNFGPDVKNYSRLKLPPIQKLSENRLGGFVLHIDKFGNVITSISPREVSTLLGPERTLVRFLVNGQKISVHCRFYAEAPTGKIFSLIGSSGYYEIAAFKKSAAKLLNLKCGAEVQLELTRAAD